MKSSIENIRHSLAHLLAAAVVELWPDAKPTIGPAIENGFYYDFEFKKPVSEEDLPKIEKRMREILKTWDKFTGKKVSKKEALAYFKNNPYKQELIEEISDRGEDLTFYTSDKFTDLCRGGHVGSAKEINPEAFKLGSIAGAYWRGSEKNAMLTRIYAVAFETKKELEDYLKLQEEAKKRDHRILGTRLGLFLFHNTAPGMPYWLPKGLIVYNTLVNFWRREHQKEEYQEIASPLLNKKELYVTSGHWKHYLEQMFITQTEEGETYAVKAMNCPNAMIVYGSKPRSYRELPLRLADTDRLHRYERSGTLNGLLRVRAFRQDDAHIFVTEEQIKEEYKRIFETIERFYSIFQIDYSFRMGTRPAKFMGDVETWDKAEAALEKILKDTKKKYTILEGDGAFYGPKIDILMKDTLGREWQMGTIQLDFQIPKNFSLKYTDAQGKEKTPVTIHRVIYGSLERFIAILIEHFAGAFPLWLAPIQVSILPVGEKQHPYAQKIEEELKANDIRAEIDNSNETLGKRIRESELQKIPYILVVGEREASKGTVNIRHYHRGQEGELDIKKLLTKIKKEVTEQTI